MAYIVKELCTSVSINVMGVEVTPPKLNVEPVLITRCPVIHILALKRVVSPTSTHKSDLTHIGDKRRPGNIPL